MPVPFAKVIARVKLPKGVTLHVDPVRDRLRILRNGTMVGEITRRQVDDTNGKIDGLLVKLLAQSRIG